MTIIIFRYKISKQSQERSFFMKTTRKEKIQLILDDMICFEREELYNLAKKEMARRLSSMNDNELDFFVDNYNALPFNERVA